VRSTSKSRPASATSPAKSCITQRARLQAANANVHAVIVARRGTLVFEQYFIRDNAR
jgi:hypothetical protein